MRILIIFTRLLGIFLSLTKYLPLGYQFISKAKDIRGQIDTAVFYNSDNQYLIYKMIFC